MAEIVIALYVLVPETGIGFVLHPARPDRHHASVATRPSEPGVVAGAALIVGVGGAMIATDMSAHFKADDQLPID